MAATRRLGRTTLSREVAEVRLLHAWRLRAAGRLEEADAAFRSLLIDSPANAKAHIGLATVCWDRAMPGETEAHLRQALELAPDDARGLAFLGSVCAANGAPEEARALLGKIDLRRADAGRDCLVIARLAHRLGELDMAAAALQRYLLARPTDERAYADLIALGEPRVRQVLARIVRRHPALGLPKTLRAITTRTGQSAALNAALHADPGNPLALWWTAKRMMRRSDSRAIGLLERALLQVSEEACLVSGGNIAATLIAAYQQFGFVAEALATIERALARFPRDPAVLTGAARTLAAQGGSQQAWGLLRRSIAVQPEAAASWQLAAELQAERGAWPQAVACARRMVSLAPTQADGWALMARLSSGAAGMARLWLRLGRWQEAATACQAVLMVSPGDSAAWRGLAEAWSHLGWTDVRKRWVERWMPASRPCGAWLCVAMMTDEREVRRGALAAAAKVVVGYGDGMAVGHAALAAEANAEAVTAFAGALAAQPEDQEAWFAYGQALLVSGRATEALPWLRGGVGLMGEPDAWLVLADAEVEAGELKAALRTLWQVVAQWPQAAQGWYQLATCLRAAGDLTRAAWALVRYSERATHLPPAERAAIRAPLAGLQAAIRYYEEAWRPGRHRQVAYWRPPGRRRR